MKPFCGMLDGLPFLPQDKVQAGMQYLKQRIADPEGMEALVDYFNANYVTGTFRREQPTPAQQDDAVPALRLVKIPPRFDVPVWNVHHIFCITCWSSSSFLLDRR